MASIFNAFNKSSDFPRSAIDALLGAAGTRVAMGALRRYPKTAIAMAVIAGAGALFGGLKKAADSKTTKPARTAKPRPKARKVATAAA
jgi:hypothetical protein